MAISPRLKSGNQTSAWLRAQGQTALADKVDRSEITAADAMSMLQRMDGRYVEQQPQFGQEAFDGPTIGPIGLPNEANALPRIRGAQGLLQQDMASPQGLPQAGIAAPAPQGQGMRLPSAAAAQFRNMTPQDQQRFMQGVQGGLSPNEAMQPEGFLPYDPMQDQGAFGGPERIMPAQMQISGGAGNDTLAGQASSDALDIDTGAGVVGLNARLFESRAAGYALRSQASHEIISDLEDQGTEFWSNQADLLPFGAGNYLVDSEFQMYDQARRDFINAVLRRESGAVIAESEFESGNRQYFPQPGDSPEVIAQKRVNRENSIRSMRLESGRAIDALPAMGGVATLRYNPETGQLEQIQ